jgi:ATPase subunit of ABC transporter with duplicated ATPase domains
LVAGDGRPVVGPISFSAAAGAAVGLWGANGVGKSTVLNAIAGVARRATDNLHPPTVALLIEVLAAERGRRAVLLVSHERRFLDAACSRVLTVNAWQGGE